MSGYTDEEFRDLQERVALIEEMSAHPGWTLLVDRAHATMGPNQQRILRGKFEDFTAYQKEVAWLEGAFFVLQLPDVVRKELDVELAFRAEIELAEAEEAA